MVNQRLSSAGSEDDCVFSDYYNRFPGELQIFFEISAAAFEIRHQQSVNDAAVRIKKNFRVPKLAVHAAVREIYDFLIADFRQSHIFDSFTHNKG